MAYIAAECVSSHWAASATYCDQGQMAANNLSGLLGLTGESRPSGTTWLKNKSFFVPVPPRWALSLSPNWSQSAPVKPLYRFAAQA